MNLKDIGLKLITMGLFKKKNNKIFCIGCNKTGTTSLGTALKNLGFKLGDQRTAEFMFNDWVKRDFSKLDDYCLHADAFQDVPFSLPETFIYLDKKFKGSKFILTIRDSPEEWYNSLVNFHSKLWGNGKIPTAKDLQEANYLYKGFPYEGFKLLYNTSDVDLYNKKSLTDFYIDHNNSALNYFRNREKDLLILNLKESGAYLKFCSFVGKIPVKADFPWENKT